MCVLGQVEGGCLCNSVCVCSDGGVGGGGQGGMYVVDCEVAASMRWVEEMTGV